MELIFVHRRKRGEWPVTRKIVKLPDAPVGVLAVELDEGRFLEIARMFQGEVFAGRGVLDPDDLDTDTLDDREPDALHEALFEFEENFPRARFEAQLKEFAATQPNPLALVVFARQLADDLGVDLSDLNELLEAAE